jgi:hypothetical protein
VRLDEVMKVRALKIEGFTVINEGKRFATDPKQLKDIIETLLRNTETPLDGIIFQSNASYQE